MRHGDTARHTALSAPSRFPPAVTVIGFGEPH
jgi:hypothetical protein